MLQKKFILPNEFKRFSIELILFLIYVARVFSNLTESAPYPSQPSLPIPFLAFESICELWRYLIEATSLSRGSCADACLLWLSHYYLLMSKIINFFIDLVFGLCVSVEHSYIFCYFSFDSDIPFFLFLTLLKAMELVWSVLANVFESVLRIYY